MLDQEEPLFNEYSILTLETNTELSQVMLWVFCERQVSPPLGLVMKFPGQIIENEELLTSFTSKPLALLILTKHCPAGVLGMVQA